MQRGEHIQEGVGSAEVEVLCCTRLSEEVETSWRGYPSRTCYTSAKIVSLRLGITAGLGASRSSRQL
jgi:hypothetical protein